jgi:hypothetical protein
MIAGYYRVNYDVTNWQLISKALQWNISNIHSINRAQLVDDALALARAKLLDYVTALDTTWYLNLETEYVPWLSSLSALRYLGDRLMYDQKSRQLYQVSKIFCTSSQICRCLYILNQFYNSTIN